MSLRTNIWKKMFRAFGLILALTLIPFLIAMLVLHKTAWELARPYLAFAVPQLILLPVAMWLRRWEERGPSPRLIALCWSLSVAIFVAAIDGAIFYSGVELHIVNPTVGDLVFVGATSVLFASVPVYYRALPVIVARACAGHR